MAAGKKTGGRQRGTPNKVSRDLKAAILEAAEQAGESFGPDGMVSYLKAQATLTPGPFMALLGKVLPTTLAGDASSPIEMVHKIERAIVHASDRNSGGV